ncbi:SsgA family sporulation/cell division regulator [Modestobacter sp. I12A-02628]|uniref:SsgA family sporulation/cell division regulator n=1 Tax=Goekera deserti TaxID=2497753 RepID=A0A7K3WA68_9ACTN|nr:SsgA family sporulation/cell division regulator [Goekera deserti]MPQ99206.1 SsgA family sporulation/cell division regulator [Goekera deserti]NDI47541.1 SsgA family sporulation/cell division regulator [Goekera deserti]NEL53352.1 SsgA family sporulation/cell division regulator [Goekera deserti]
MPSRRATGCSTRATLHLVGPHSWTAVPAALRYELAEPFAVRVLFGTDAERGEGDPGVEWLLSRDLLRSGTTRPAGEGDVRLWPGRGGSDALFLQLRAPSGEALFELSRGVVEAFLARTEELVPRGTETGLLLIDDELIALLQDDGTDPTGR